MCFFCLLHERVGPGHGEALAPFVTNADMWNRSAEVPVLMLWTAPIQRHRNVQNCGWY